MIFFIVFTVIILSSLILAIYPLRKNYWIALLFTPAFLAATFLGYSQWGSYLPWTAYLQSQRNQSIVKQLIETPYGSTQLIQKLQVQLTKTPNSAKGWFLLGRILASKGEWKAANNAFAKAIKLNPNDEKALINYAQSLWEIQQRQFDKTTRSLFKKILKTNPEQPDALSMLALDYFQQQNYPMAINYWEKLLKLVPSQSEEALGLQRAIAKAIQLKSKH